MPRDPRASLEDMRRAAVFLLDLTAGRTLDDYRADEVLRSVVERKFEIIGEALSQLARIDPSLVARVPEHRKIISFRNILIHGYFAIDDDVVWQVVQEDLPALHRVVADLVAEVDSGGGASSDQAT